ncbi:hypothetical protein RB195_000836 [Necator americanus]|uniref:SCP domain-containing protein n=1 Tax=Necator americanus TaxID=51031 RepID=A0ABR1DCW8_NECAM
MLPLSILFALRSLGNDEIYCPQSGGKAKENADVKPLLTYIKNSRLLLLKNRQRNGPDGYPMPMAKSMGEVRWSCELEKKAYEMFDKRCKQTEIDLFNLRFPQGYSGIYFPYHQAHTYEQAAQSWTGQIDRAPMNDTAFCKGKVVFIPNRDIQEYATLIQQDSYNIGCSQLTCRFWFGTLCLIDRPAIDSHQVLYETDTCNDGDEFCNLYPLNTKKSALDSPKE